MALTRESRKGGVVGHKGKKGHGPVEVGHPWKRWPEGTAQRAKARKPRVKAWRAI